MKNVNKKYVWDWKYEVKAVMWICIFLFSLLFIFGLLDKLFGIK